MRPDPAVQLSITPTVPIVSTSAEMGTQTDVITVNRNIPVVGFLENTECTLEESDIPNCYHFGANASFVRSPRIPVVVEGVRVPMIIDTGAEVSILSTKFMQDFQIMNCLCKVERYDLLVVVSLK